MQSDGVEELKLEEKWDAYFALPPPPPRKSLWRRMQMFWQYRILWPLSVVVSCLWKKTLGRYIYIKQTAMAYEESANMKFVRRWTSLPVPRVFLTFHIPPWVFWWRRNWHPRRAVPRTSDAFIFMERIDGQSLNHDTWLSFDVAARDHIIAQLHGYLRQLRELKPPMSAVIGSIGGRPVCDNRLAQGWPTNEEAGISGPYQDEAEMNRALRRQRAISEFRPSVAESHARRHPLVFTHGDLDLRNIMVKGGKVVALIDWESAGWFPAHWEYLKAHWVPIRHAREEEWRNRLREVMTPYELERKADQELIQTIVDDLSIR